MNNIMRFPFSALTLLVRQQEVHPACRKTGCWFVGGDSLTAACTSYSSSCYHLILSSNKIQNGDILVPANPGPPGKWRMNNIV